MNDSLQDAQNKASEPASTQRGNRLSDASASQRLNDRLVLKRLLETGAASARGNPLDSAYFQNLRSRARGHAID